MRFWIVLLSVYIYLVSAAEVTEEDDYQYDETAEIAKDTDGAGDRLVGASRGDAKKLTFLVGYSTTYRGSDSVSCTGSLITSTWVVSAAHCILHLIPFEDTKKCLQLSKENKSYRNRKLKQDFKCSLMAKGNLKIEYVDVPGFAYIGVGNTMKKDEVIDGEKISIKFVVRHANTYHGGGNYGTYGGYDITLLHLTEPVAEKYKPACLPGPSYKDSGIGPHYNKKNGGEKANLAGFGRYRRDPCMTDRFGPMKYHYCANDCTEDAPPPKNPACNNFFANPSTPNEIPDGDEELYIDGPRLIKCHKEESPEKGSKGWCKVNKSANKIGILEDANSWGFCGKDCYIPENKDIEPESSVLRKVLDIDILDEELCRYFLQDALPANGKVKFMPHILCIGEVKTPKFSVWHKSKNGYAKGAVQFKKHPLTLERRPDVYVHSAGTCNGDSGGPVFTKDDASGNFVTLGAVSGGRGELRHCGGINNPTHYVRLKMFVPWIKLMMGKDAEKICLVG